MLMLLAVALLAADAPVCPKCEAIREYNAAHPENNYTYYEDYLEAQKQKGELAGCGCVKKDKREPVEREDHIV